MSWAIIADSSCNLRSYTPTSPKCSFALAPLKIELAGKEYVDDEHLDVDDLNRRIAASNEQSGSACPSVGEWSELFNSAENVIALTISSSLSGSYDAAVMAREMVLENPNSIAKHICVVDSKLAGGPLEIAVMRIDRYLTNNPQASFDEVSAYAEALLENSQVLFSLSSYQNLTKSGRMPKLVGALASSLSIRMLGTATPEGTIKVVGPTRGDKKTFAKIIDVMSSDGCTGGLISIDHVGNADGAARLRDTMLTVWPDAEIVIMPCGGLCSYYAEQTGLIIGYTKT